MEEGAEAPAPELSVRYLGPRRVARTLRRRLVVPTCPAEGVELSVVSWNILADGLTSPQQFPYASRAALAWDLRRQLIVAELLDLGADVYCLQEVQQEAFDYILEAMQARGDYEGVYFQKPGGRLDGCATLYRSDKLNLHSWTPLPLAQLLGKHFGPAGPGAGRRSENQNRAEKAFGEARALGWEQAGVDVERMVREGLATPGDRFWLEAAAFGNVAILCELECVESDHRILVSNTHLHWDPRFPEVKAVQMHAVLQECGRRMRRCIHGRPDAFLLAGDFNSVPRKNYSDEYDDVPEAAGLVSGVYQLALAGELAVDHAHHPAHRRCLQGGESAGEARSGTPSKTPSKFASGHPSGTPSRTPGGAPSETPSETSGEAPSPAAMAYTPERDPTPAEARGQKTPLREAHLSPPRTSVTPSFGRKSLEGSEVSLPPELRPWSHSLGLASAYRDVCGDEPAATNITRGFEGTLDYIFYCGQGVEAAGVLLLPGDDVLRASEGLPNESIPSDHVSLQAHFRLPPVPRRERRASRSNSLSHASHMTPGKRRSQPNRRSLGSSDDFRGRGMGMGTSLSPQLVPIVDGSNASPSVSPALMSRNGSLGQAPPFDLGADAPEFVPTFRTPGTGTEPPCKDQEPDGDAMEVEAEAKSPGRPPARARGVSGDFGGARRNEGEGKDPLTVEAVPEAGTCGPVSFEPEEDEPEADVEMHVHGVRVTSSLLPPLAPNLEQDAGSGNPDFSTCYLVETAFFLEGLVAQGEVASAAPQLPVDVSVRVTNATVALEYPGLPPIQLELPAHVYPTAIETHFDRVSKVLTVTAPAMAFRSPVYYVPRRPSGPPTPGVTPGSGGIVGTLPAAVAAAAASLPVAVAATLPAAASVALIPSPLPSPRPAPASSGTPRSEARPAALLYPTASPPLPPEPYPPDDGGFPPLGAAT